MGIKKEEKSDDVIIILFDSLVDRPVVLCPVISLFMEI